MQKDLTMKEQIILNPISALIKNCVIETIDKLKIAVPFVNSFAKKIIEGEDVQNIKAIEKHSLQQQSIKIITEAAVNRSIVARIKL
ncbi:MAG: hypothetical protein KAI79_11605 [Bacteroidales bacterium]|nr:hypothetical protein [Bacteroidales bacterium]